MTTDWIVFSPFDPHWAIPSDLNLPFSMGPQVACTGAPEWLFADSPFDPARSSIRHHWNGPEHPVVQVRYQAESLQSSMAVDHQNEESPHGIAIAQLMDVTLALWLARPGAQAIQTVIIAESRDGDWVTRATVTHDPVLVHSSERHADLTSQDFLRARKLFTAIRATNAALRSASFALSHAIIEQSALIRHVLLWIVLEALFGAEDGREITHRISQRAAIFLARDRTEAKAMSKFLKESYGRRSKTVHGMRSTSLKEEQAMRILYETEVLVRRAMSTILSNDGHRRAFDSRNRESFLEDLAYRSLPLSTDEGPS